MSHGFTTDLLSLLLGLDWGEGSYGGRCSWIDMNSINFLLISNWDCHFHSTRDSGAGKMVKWRWLMWRGCHVTVGDFVQQKTRRGSWRAEIGEAWVGKGPAHHFRYFAVLGKRWKSVVYYSPSLRPSGIPLAYTTLKQTGFSFLSSVPSLETFHDSWCVPSDQNSPVWQLRPSAVWSCHFLEPFQGSAQRVC